jgi:hypothetical protein
MNQEKMKAKAFRKSLEKADNQLIVESIDEVCNAMIKDSFDKPTVKHRVEIMLRNKRPRVNSITRSSYRKLCDFARVCAAGNSQMLGLVTKFEKNFAI